jgi:hypothetical protein
MRRIGFRAPAPTDLQEVEDRSEVAAHHVLRCANMATHLLVGGDIDAQCTKCRMLLGHTILAMVGDKPARVRCNTCQGEHNFHAPEKPAGATVVAAKKKRKAASPARPSVTSWEALVVGRDLSRPRRYSAKEQFAVDDVLDHPVFGLGIVRDQRHDKIEVAFQGGPRTLVHARHAN